MATYLTTPTSTLSNISASRQKKYDAIFEKHKSDPRFQKMVMEMAKSRKPKPAPYTPPAKLLTFQELAKSLGLPDTSARRLLQRHGIHGTKVGAREVFSEKLARKICDWHFNFSTARGWDFVIERSGIEKDIAYATEQRNRLDAKATAILKTITTK